MKRIKSYTGWTWKDWDEDFDCDVLLISGFHAVSIPHIFHKKPRLKNIKKKVRITIEEI